MRALSKRKRREGDGLFVAEGIRVVEDLLSAGITVVRTAVSPSIEDTDRGRCLIAELRRRNVPVEDLSERDIQELSDTEAPQGVLAIARIPQRTDADVAQVLEEGLPVLLFDAVQDPGNFGTLTRSAEALGVGLVIALPGTVDAWNSKAIRSSAGSNFRIPIVQMAAPAAVDLLRSHGYAILGADSEGEAIDGVRSTPAALILGNEGAGLSEEARSLADRLVAIPIRGRAESLNVAAAGAILLYELCR